MIGTWVKQRLKEKHLIHFLDDGRLDCLTTHLEEASTTRQIFDPHWFLDLNHHSYFPILFGWCYILALTQMQIANVMSIFLRKKIPKQYAH